MVEYCELNEEQQGVMRKKLQELFENHRSTFRDLEHHMYDISCLEDIVSNGYNGEELFKLYKNLSFAQEKKDFFFDESSSILDCLDLQNSADFLADLQDKISTYLPHWDNVLKTASKIFVAIDNLIEELEQ